jgi:hypothetical protein
MKLYAGAYDMPGMLSSRSFPLFGIPPRYIKIILVDLQEAVAFRPPMMHPITQMIDCQQWQRQQIQHDTPALVTIIAVFLA